MAIDSETKPKVISPSRLAHVVLRTNNMKALVAFYTTFLGARISHENDTLAFLTYDEEHHRIAIVQIPPLAPKNPMTCGLEHISFTFDSLADLMTAYHQRKAHDILPIWCVNHGPTTSMYYRDPDGNTIETQVENFETADEANAFMTSKEFAENPFGVDFEPEDFARRVEAGENDAVLKKRVEIGPRGVETVPLLD